MDRDDEKRTRHDKFLFGSGFTFGVMFTLLILAVVIAAIVQEGERSLLSTDAFLSATISVLLAGIVGAMLYFLAFPEKPLEIPLHGDGTESGSANDTTSDEATGK
jgi:uncharacterized membrane protein YraQ (UPF0718 family)